VRQQPERKVRRRVRRGTVHRWLAQLRRRAARGILGRISLGTAAKSSRLRRWVLAAALLGIVLVPYPTQGAVAVPPAAACRSGCRPGYVPSMVRWTSPLPGSWQVVSGLTGTVPSSGLAYVSVGHGVAAVGAGLTLYAFSSASGAPLWHLTLTGFPAGAAIVSVRTWPGEITAGVSYSGSERTEVVVPDWAGVQPGPHARFPAAVFGGAVAGGPKYTVIVGATAVTSYDNVTGRVRWRLPTGPVAQAWRTDGNWLYVAESDGGFLGSAPVAALRKINMVTGTEFIVRPLEGLSFPGTLSAAFDGVVLFSTASRVVAYSGTTGAWLWSISGAVPEGYDPAQHRIYLTMGSNLIGVSPLTGQIEATASGSAVDASAGMYVVRDGVALGLDQGGGGDAWGYDIAVQRVILAASGLPWPHYFVDLSGVGGSADPATNTVIIAACRQLAPSSPASPSPSPSPDLSPTSAASETALASPTSSPNPTQPPAEPTGQASSATPTPTPTPSASPLPGPIQGCLRPELVALNL
jgi:outer membrane protein assembly factor BamB